MHIYCHCPDTHLTKSAGKLSDSWKLFRAGFGKRWHGGAAERADNVATRFTKWGPEKGADGLKMPAQSVDDIRGSSSMFDKNRVKWADRATASRAKSEQYAKDLEGLGGGWGSKIISGAGQAGAYVPRYMMAHPAALGIAPMATAAVIPQMDSFSLPAIGGRMAYHGLGHSKADAKNYATVGALNSYSDFSNHWRNMPLSQRLLFAGTQYSPQQMQQMFGSATNTFKPKNFGWSTLLRGGQANPQDIRSMISSTMNNKANQFSMNKTASKAKTLSSIGGAIADKFKPVTSGITNAYRSMPRPARIGLGVTGTAAFPLGLGYMGYSGEKEKMMTTAFDQGYNTGQYQITNQFQNLPWWQRYGAAIAPDTALSMANRKLQSVLSGNAHRTAPGYLGQPSSQGMSYMYRNWDGSSVY